MGNCGESCVLPKTQDESMDLTLDPRAHPKPDLMLTHFVIPSHQGMTISSSWIGRDDEIVLPSHGRMTLLPSIG